MFFDEFDNRWGDAVARIGFKGRENGLKRDSICCCIPKGDRSNAIKMNVFEGFCEFSKSEEMFLNLLEGFMMGINEDGLVGLNGQCTLPCHVSSLWIVFCVLAFKKFIILSRKFLSVNFLVLCRFRKKRFFVFCVRSEKACKENAILLLRRRRCFHVSREGESLLFPCLGLVLLWGKLS